MKIDWGKIKKLLVFEVSKSVYRNAINANRQPEFDFVFYELETALTGQTHQIKNSIIFEMAYYEG